jgi:Zn-dependent protease with chaperone function
MLRILLKRWLFPTLTLFLLISHGKVNAQLPVHSTPLWPDTSDEANIRYFEDYFRAEKDTVSVKNSTAKKYVLQQCSTRVELFKDFVKRGELLSETEIDSIVQKVAANIINANPELRGKVKVFVSRSLVPNAFCTGNTMVVLNIGMLSRLENEAQLAFILCHEFSHQMMNHSNNAIYKHAFVIGDKQYARKIKSTLKEEYNVTSKLKELMLPGLLKDMAYSRYEEFAADSMGIKYLSNTDYDLSAALGVMDILDKIDSEYKNEPLDLRKFFTLPQVPVGPYWFDYKGSSSLGAFETVKDSLEDSLKTHPDCKLRKERLQSQIENSSVKKQIDTDRKAFEKMVLISKCESVQYMFDTKNIGRSMFLALRMLEERPQDVYHRSMVSMCMAYFSRLKTIRMVGKCVQPPHPEFSESYNRFLYFIQELTPKESGEIAYWMINPATEELKNHEVYFSALIYAAYSSGRTEEYQALKKEYSRKFPKGRYTKVLDVLPES